MRRKTWMVKLAAGMASLLLLTGLCACSHTNQEESSSQASQVEDLSLFPEGASIGGKNIAGKTVEEALEIARMPCKNRWALRDHCEIPGTIPSSSPGRTLSPRMCWI